jgi:serine/threonine-protein kinase
MDRIGRYKIVRELGRGAMGIVYHAIDPNIGRPVAIKTIQLGQGRKPEEMERMRERLFREARSAGMLSHPGIVTIYDVEQQGDLAYIAMEYVDGPTLDQLMNEPATMAPEKMFSILAQAAVALDYAHSKGIVHRDVKPANIMITKDGTTKITDFGIAKITAIESLTMTNAIVGTPHYMSPEQVQGQPIDGRSDQFSLTVIAYELLTGEKPYTGEHLTTVVYKIVAEEPALPHRLNPSITGGIESVIRKGLSKRADSRYRNCQEFTAALEEACLAAKGWKLMPRGGVLNEPTIADVASPGAPPPLPPPRRPRGRETTATVTRKKLGFLPFLVAVLFVAGLLAGIGWQELPWLMPSARHDQHAQEQSPLHPPDTQSPAKPTLPGEEKPSPVGPAQTPPVTSQEPASTPPTETKSATEEAPKRAIEEPARQEPPKSEPKVNVQQVPGRRGGAAQDVLAVSSPGGATATLDGNPAIACTTPCTLPSPPGRHTVSFVLAGHQIERREINVGGGPVEMPPVMLRAAVGTLMLSSVPTGASVSVDGKKIDMVTPAQIPLTFGTYSVTVEKDGKRSTEKIEITNTIKFYRINVGQ